MKANNTFKVVLKEALNIVVVSLVWIALTCSIAFIAIPVVALFTKLVVNSWKFFYNLI